MSVTAQTWWLKAIINKAQYSLFIVNVFQRVWMSVEFPGFTLSVIRREIKERPQCPLKQPIRIQLVLNDGKCVDTNYLVIQRKSLNKKCATCLALQYIADSIKGCFRSWQLGIDHLGIQNYLQRFPSMTTKYQLPSAQFPEPKATWIIYIPLHSESISECLLRYSVVTLSSACSLHHYG